MLKERTWFYAALSAALLLAGCQTKAPSKSNPAASAATQIKSSADPIFGFGVSPNGQRFAISTKERPRLWVFDLDEYSDSWSIDRSASINPGWLWASGIWFSPNSEIMVCDEGAGSSGTKEYLFTEGSSLSHVLLGGTDLTFLRFSKDNKTLTGITMFDIFRWDVRTGKVISKDRLFQDWDIASFLPGTQGEQAIFADKQRSWFVWDIAKRKKTQPVPFLNGKKDGDWRIGMYQGRWAIYWVQNDDTVQVIDPMTSKPIKSVAHKGLGKGLRGVYWNISPGGKWIGWRNAARNKLSFIQVQDPKITAEINGAISQDWCFLNEDYVCDRSTQIEAYEIATGKLALTILPDLGPINYTRDTGIEHDLEAYEPEAWLAYLPTGQFAGTKGAEKRVEEPLQWKRDDQTVAKEITRILKPTRADQTYWMLER